uniref:M14 family metallopeptidase n=1 Tax=Flavobacterium sp. TaxID=239 RepID=UPI004048F071
MKVQILGFFFMWFGFSIAQSDYLSYDQMTTKLQAISNANALSSLQSIGKSASGKDIWALQLGVKDAKKPALLIVASLDGKHPAGSQISLLMVEKWLKNTDMQKWLQSNQIFVIPMASPDAMPSQKPLYEKSGNSKTTDDDRNGKTNDDPYEDLNKDGFITQMRIESPKGTHIVYEEDPRVLIPADASQGQIGKYLVLTEGTDNNKNEIFNEDASDGVVIDKNFAYNYPIFDKGSGLYAVSESETKALMDFVYAHPEIYGVLTFGPYNNLAEATKFDSKSASGRLISSLLEEDVKSFNMLQDFYQNKANLKDGKTIPFQGGNFPQTAYFHAGKMSVASPGWWFPKVEIPKDSTQNDADKKKKKDDVVTPDLAKFLQWSDQEGHDVFVPWQTIQHPDFTNQNVEIGGLKPFAMLNPPMKYLDSIAEKHLIFIDEWLKAMPKVVVSAQKIEKIDTDLFRITLSVANKGLLPTYTSIANRIRFTSKFKTEIVLQNNQNRVSGKKIAIENAIQPDQELTYSWLISGRGKVVVKTGCATTGEQEITFDLK